jgi:hypothetical protein
MPRKRGPGRPRNVGRPKITGKYAQKKSPTIKEVKGIVRKSERAWMKRKPRSQKDLQDLYNTCGIQCFLDGGITGTSEFVVCRKCGKKECYCYPDCDALLHVKRNANISGLVEIEDAAQTLAEQLGCEWDDAIKIILTEQYPLTLELL